MLEIGSIVGGKYKVLSVVGQGGMSTVYLAMNERANKPWAIKEVRKDGVMDFQLVKQSLITETELLKELSHPYLPSIVDVIDEEGRLLIVMDYIEGNTLEKALSQYGAQPQEYVIEWGIQLCDVLEYLHTREPAIIYRDLKPSNIMLRPDGTITLIDFGTAREYKENSSYDTSYLGTRGYAAPEQLGGTGQTDARTDIYTLGATLYHLVTGHFPTEPPYEFYPIRYWNPQLSPGLEYIISKCVQSNPADRYASCAEVMYDLQNYKELDRGYKKEAKIGVTLFSFVTVACLIFGALSFVFHAKASSLARESYDSYILEAKSTTDELSASDMYINAIVLNPGDATAYIDLLDNLLLVDDNYTKEEDEMVRELLITPVGNSTVEKKLAADKDAYAQVAYKLGVAYFYCYEETGNKQMSSKWFHIASEQGTLSESQQFRAEKLGNIADYYSRLGTESSSGDIAVSYKQYWDDLVDVAEGNIAEADNPVTALVIYKEIASLVYANSGDLIKSGVSVDEMNAEITTLITHINSDIKSKPDVTDKTKELVADTMTAFERARSALETTPGNKEDSDDDN